MAPKVPLSQILQLTKSCETTYFSEMCRGLNKITWLQESGTVTGISGQLLVVTFLSFLLSTFLRHNPFLICTSSMRALCLDPSYLQSSPSCKKSSTVTATYSDHSLCYFPNWPVKITKAWRVSHTRKIQRSKMRLIIKGLTLNFPSFPPKEKNKAKYFGSLNISENTGPMVYN